MPKVSIIVPNYNHYQYLSKRMDSILQQTYQDFELIILDDCSTDNSRTILAQYAEHPKVSHVIFNETNGKSTFKQWKKGLELAQGEYIWIAETDDFCETGLLETAVNTLELNKSDLFFCQSYNVDEDNNVVGDFLFWTESFKDWDWGKAFTMSGMAFIEKFLRFKNVIINASAVVFRKNALGSLPDEVLEFRYCGDWKTWLTILKGKDATVSYTPQSLNFFRTHTQTTRNLDSWQKTIIRKAEDVKVISEAYSIVNPAEGNRKMRTGYWELAALTPIDKRKELIEITKMNVSLFSFFPFVAIKSLIKARDLLSRTKH